MIHQNEANTPFSEEQVWGTGFEIARARVAAWGAFDERWYRAQAPSIGEDAIGHYLLEGEAIGLTPSPLFDPVWVATQLDQVTIGGILTAYLKTDRYRRASPHPLFDTRFYLALYGDEIGLEDPLSFYIREGWRRGHDPNPAFDSAWYAHINGLANHEQPLEHYRSIGAERGLFPAAGFDPVWVRALYARYPAAKMAPGSPPSPLELYLRLPIDQRSPNAVFTPSFYAEQVGPDALKGMDPFWHFRRVGLPGHTYVGPAFDSEYYLSENPELAQAPLDPLAHYVMHGAREGRRAHPLFDEDWYVRQPSCTCGDRSDALAHFLLDGWRAGMDPHPLFDSAWYLGQYRDVAEMGVNPWTHYLRYGWRERRRPNRLFDTDWYLRTNPDVVAKGSEPAGHYHRFGLVEGRDPGPEFSTFRYLLAHGRVLGQRTDLLAHYLREGEGAGFECFPVGGSNGGDSIALGGAVQPPTRIDPYSSWQEVNSLTPDSSRRLRARLDATPYESLPLISVVMPCYNSDPALLSEAIESVEAQVYGNWELCICDDASPSPVVAEVVERLASREPRIKHCRNPLNLGIGGATNAAVALATGEVLAFLDHDDLLHPHALAELALAYASGEDVDMVYTDDDKIDTAGRRYSPQFKPDWSPVLLLSFMYMSHLFSMRRALFVKVGGVRPAFDGSQDYDLALRASEHARRVLHVPKVLYHWRAIEGSTAVSGDAKPEAILRGQRAVQEAFERRGYRARIGQPSFAEASRIGVFEPVFGDEGPSVTILIPTRNGLELLKACVESLKATTYRNFDVLIVDNESDEPEALAYMASCGAGVLRVASPSEGFSFAHVVNAGVREAKSEYVLLLNNDTEVRNARWLSQMMGYAQIPGVGAVGARLLYEDCKVQHGGITHGLNEGMAGHSFKLLPEWDPGYLQLALTSRETAGVTAACLLTPRALYLEMGGLDEENFRVAYNDVDFCYRLVDSGYSCIQCASAELFHFEGKTRGFVDNPREITAMRRKYRQRRDQFYNPNLSLENERFEVARSHVAEPRSSPVRTLFVSHNFNHEGAPNSLFELASGLRAAKRVDPVVIAPENGPMLKRYDEAGIETALVDNPLIGWLPEDQFEANLRRMGQSFRYAGAEVVVANTADSFWAVAAAARVGLPSIWIIRESEPWESYFAHFPAHIAQTAYDCFTTPYRVVFVARTTLEAWKPLDSKGNFTLNRNGLDTDSLISGFEGHDRETLRAELGIPADVCLFTCVGTVCERKGQIDLVRAFAKLSESLASRAALALIGDRPSDYSTALHAEIASLPEDRRMRVIVLDETSRARSFLVGSDVFVCCSRVESYPRVTLEAMAAGLPIVTTGVWGITEQVRAGYNALLYEPGRDGELAAHMGTMIEQPELREAFSLRAIPVLESLPDFEFMRDRYADLIDQAAGSC